MNQIRSFKDLAVWQHGIALAIEAYKATGTFPKSELFGLTGQIRRAASSIPANIAEGWGRDGTKEFLQFLRISRGSLSELETHLILAERLQFLPALRARDLSARIEAISKMLYSLSRSLETKLETRR